MLAWSGTMKTSLIENRFFFFVLKWRTDAVFSFFLVSHLWQERAFRAYRMVIGYKNEFDIMLGTIKMLEMSFFTQIKNLIFIINTLDNILSSFFSVILYEITINFKILNHYIFHIVEVISISAMKNTNKILPFTKIKNRIKFPAQTKWRYLEGRRKSSKFRSIDIE